MDALLSVVGAVVLLLCALLAVVAVAALGIVAWVIFAPPDETWENGLVLTRDTPRAPGVDKGPTGHVMSCLVARERGVERHRRTGGEGLALGTGTGGASAPTGPDSSEPRSPG